ncbi:hypothetical protein NQ317_009074 [Molorchus minor]|uniref:Uncharacterized protein n=1 Tax=Molorchus minor TaxID=1323400 RepID=A0ABQ9IRK5_9CUCU|nr:hypothetical protein NQ317_009074 [Molorchus minor]
MEKSSEDRQNSKLQETVINELVKCNDHKVHEQSSAKKNHNLDDVDDISKTKILNQCLILKHNKK